MTTPGGTASYKENSISESFATFQPLVNIRSSDVLGGQGQNGRYRVTVAGLASVLVQAAQAMATIRTVHPIGVFPPGTPYSRTS
jgi:hypothetical protein